MKYCVIIGAYDPPDIFYETLRVLNEKKIHTFVIYSGNGIHLKLDSEYLHIAKVPNLGIGHKFNEGMKMALSSAFDLMTLITDDVAILPDFSEQHIIDYYSRNCSKNDILHLDFVSNDLKTKKFAMDSGMTFHSWISKNIKFREDLVMDQQDIYFCYELSKMGGKITSFDKVYLSHLPVGRVIIGNMHLLPEFRIYLLTRNSLRLFMETGAFVFLKSLWYYALGSAVKSIIGNERKIIRAFLLGIVDALTGKMGITPNLQNLSKKIFMNLNEMKNPELNSLIH